MEELIWSIFPQPAFTINETLFTIFVILVFGNAIYGFVCCVLGLEKNWIFKMLGWLFAFVLILFLVDLAYHQEWGLDFAAYKEAFLTKGYWKNEGYEFIQNYFADKGIDFNSYRAIIYGSCFFLLWFCFSRFRINKNLGFAFYCLSIWGANMVLMRDFMGFCLVLTGSTFLLFKDWKRFLGIPIFAGFLYLGYTIQGSMLFMGALIFAVFSIYRRQYISIVIAIVSFAFCLGEYFGINSVTNLLDVLPEEFKEFAAQYSQGGMTLVTNIKLLIYIFYSVIGVALFRASLVNYVPLDNVLLRRSINLKESDYEKDLNSLNMIFGFICCISITAIFSMRYSHVMRFPRNMMILALGSFTIVLRNIKNSHRWPISILGLAILIIGAISLNEFLEIFEDFDLYFYQYFTGDFNPTYDLLFGEVSFSSLLSSI